MQSGPARASIVLLLILATTACGRVRLSAGPVNSMAPDVTWGGRAVAVAASPRNSASLLAASATGGVFESDSRGRRWVHTGGAWSFGVRDIEFSPASRLIIATTGDDLTSTPSGGIWVSGNGALSFGRPNNAVPPAGPRCTEWSSGYGISLEPQTGVAFVGTDCGYARSADGGASWTHVVVDPSVPVDPAKTQDRILSVVSSGAGPMYAVGKQGLYYSDDSGASWSRASSPRWQLFDRDAPPRLAVSPQNPQHAFVAVDSKGVGVDSTVKARLYVTLDGGRVWDSIRAEPNEARAPLIRISPTNNIDPGGSGYTVYYGNGPELFRAVVHNLSRSTYRSLSWNEVSVDHADVNDLALDRDGLPVLLATDGGVHVTADGGGSWTVTGAGSAGYQALQVYDVTGQIKVRSGGAHERTDLYMGTHDNRLWYSSDQGRTWLQKGGDPEGGGLQLRRTVDDYADSWITGWRCFPCYSWLTREHFRDNRRWNTPGDEKDSEALPLPGFDYVQFGIVVDSFLVPPDTMRVRRGNYLYRSRYLDSDWQRIGQQDLPVFGRVEVAEDHPGWLTYAVQNGRNPDGGTRFALRSIEGIRRMDRVRLYDATGDLGSLGSRGYDFAWTAVFGASPTRPNFIIAPDVSPAAGDPIMKVSLDGGQTWTPDAALTDSLTSGGSYQLYARRNDGESGGLLVTEISFSPENPLHVLVGTRLNGIVASNDGGLSWRRVAGSEHIPHVTRFFWDTPNERVVVSSYGRGLWSLHLGDAFYQPPAEAREIPLPGGPRDELSWRPRVMGMRLGGAGSMDGMALVESGGTLTVEGMQFQPSPNQQRPVVLTLNGRVVAQLYPDARGRFEARVVVPLPNGLHLLEAVQETDGEPIRYQESFIVAPMDRQSAPR